MVVNKWKSSTNGIHVVLGTVQKILNGGGGFSIFIGNIYAPRLFNFYWLYLGTQAFQFLLAISSTQAFQFLLAISMHPIWGSTKSGSPSLQETYLTKTHNLNFTFHNVNEEEINQITDNLAPKTSLFLMACHLN